ncbi:MAG: FkbM family methyltransferase [Chlamydiae bacterium]|nr:FkbM family methyltransferase [Chlamydiota bacterium]
MYKLANIICTTLCAMSLNQAFADDIGFSPEHEISYTSPLDTHAPITSFVSGEQSFIQPMGSEFPAPQQETQANFPLPLPAQTQEKKPVIKEVSEKPLTGKIKAEKLRIKAEADLEAPIIREPAKGDLVDYYNRIGRREDGYYSQCGQDRLLNEKWFKNKKNGVFVDIGAHNGISFSNTKFFEELGWKGICIEPIPEVYEELKKNRSCICIQGCISDRNGKSSFLRVEGEPEMLSGLLTKYDPRHLERVYREIATRSYGKAPKCIEVDCYLLNDLLRKNDVFHIDFLSIDIEGGELDVLKTIDFDQFDIEFVVIENNYRNQEIPDFLIAKGYELVANTGWDDVFKKPNRARSNLNE